MGIKRVAIGLVVAVLLFGAGFLSHDRLRSPSTDDGTGTTQADYPLLAKRIFQSSPNDVLINFVAMRQQLGKYFTDNDLSGSLYFQYLPTGTTVQTANEEQAVAASLMKLPTAMDALKAVEDGKVRLDKLITLDQSMLDSGYGELYQQGAGYKLTLGDAIRIMLQQSDNTALNAVLSVTNSLLPPAANSLNAVDVSYTTNGDQSVSISAKSYSSLLTCLYYSCYNSYQDSQLLLQDLTRTGFDDRLVAGVHNKDIVVAHKIGVFNDINQSDCGIIYVPRRPYLACIMLDGPDNATTSGYIAGLSKIIFDYVTDHS